MSIRIMSAVWDNSPCEHSLLLIHLCLADIANDEGYCWPSVATIARKCRLDERYTRKLLNQMVEDGVVERALNEGKRGTNVYLVRVTPVEKDRGVKKTGGQNRQGGEKDPLSPKTPSPLSPRTPEPSVEPSIRTNKSKGSLEELMAYAVEIGLPESDGDACFDKWQGNGWKNDGKPIVCWRSTMRSWKKFGYMASQKGTKTNGYSNNRNAAPHSPSTPAIQKLDISRAEEWFSEAYPGKRWCTWQLLDTEQKNEYRQWLKGVKEAA